jgi:hypothetical protein
LRRGAIEVSRLPYNSPIFCVLKKKLPNAGEGDPVPLRVVLDYRGVNARSMPDRYSIKEVRECIDEMGRSDSNSDKYVAAWAIARLRASKEMTLEPRSVHKVQANPFVGRHMLKPNSEGICASLDTDVGIWDAVARSDKHGQVTVAAVNITDKTYQLHKGDVIGIIQESRRKRGRVSTTRRRGRGINLRRDREGPEGARKVTDTQHRPETGQRAGGTTADSCNGSNKDKAVQDSLCS